MIGKANRTGRSDSNEHYTKMFRPTMDTPAWRALSTTAQALYPWLKLEWRGPQANNNGSISLSVSQAAARLGVKSDTAAKAFHDLQAKGFLALTQEARLGVNGAAKGSTFELTEIALRGESRPRRLYLAWSPVGEHPVRKCAIGNPTGANGTRKKAETHPENQDATIIKMGTILCKPSR
jgi:hypothetical protein